MIIPLTFWFIFAISALDHRPAAFVLNRVRHARQVGDDRVPDAKRMGLSDGQIGFACGTTEAKVTKVREEFAIYPSLFEVDTVAGEFHYRGYLF